MFSALFKPTSETNQPTVAAGIPAEHPVTLTPAVDVHDTGSEVVIRLDLPGVTSTGLEVTVDGQHLQVRGIPALPAPAGMTLTYAELKPARVYERTFTLSDLIDRPQISARISDGVARITLPRHDAVKARRIPINS
jgi:HSP20 family protein